VFNDAGADVDFRVEGDTNANLLFVNAGNDRVGIGTSSPTGGKLQVNHSDSEPGVYIFEDNAGLELHGVANVGGKIAASTLTFNTGSGRPERMRINSSGNLLVGTTSNPNSARFNLLSASGQRVADFRTGSTSASATVIGFLDGDADFCGQIFVDATANTTTYATSSDYRLKHDIAPMTDALAKVQQLKPVTYKWNHAPQITAQGFIAHELQAVCPEAVTGKKDETEIKQVEVSPAVPATFDDDGNELTPAVEAVYEEREVPVYQGVDTSFLVATLTAAIQELKAELDAAKERIAALEANTGE
jgi:hypothetical protein